MQAQEQWLNNAILTIGAIVRLSKSGDISNSLSRRGKKLSKLPITEAFGKCRLRSIAAKVEPSRRRGKYASELSRSAKMEQRLFTIA
jgi:hypothetical protein